MARSREERDAADRRFTALRQSGYQGPIDQDGYENHDYDHVFASMDQQGRAHGVPGYRDGDRRNS